MADAAIEIGDFRLDTAGGVLSRGGEVVPVRAKTFAFLCHLARNRGRVVSKDELLDSVWPGLYVSEDSLAQCASELRKVFGAGPDGMLRTIPKRGYMLAGHALPDAGAATGRVFPSIAILPFRNRGDAADDAVIDGMVEEITYGLARFKSIVVIARDSAFAFPAAGRPPMKDIGERLGAGFVAEGSVLRANGRLLVSVTLTHVQSGQRLWGNQFDFAEIDLFSMNAEIAARIISRLVSNIDRAILQQPVPSASLAAFENFARGVAFLRGYGPGVNERAKLHFERAIEIDPECAVAHAYLALSDVIIADYASAPRAALERAHARANLAIALEPEEARCHRIMGLIRLYMREHEASEDSLRRAYDLNPYDADVLAQLGFVIAMRGRPAEGLVWLEKAIALNPFRPYWYDQDLLYVFYALGRYDEVISIVLKSPELGPHLNMWLAAAYSMAGYQEKAAEALSRVGHEQSGDDIEQLARGWTEFEHESDFNHLLDGLRMAQAVRRAQCA